MPSLQRASEVYIETGKNT